MKSETLIISIAVLGVAYLWYQNEQAKRDYRIAQVNANPVNRAVGAVEDAGAALLASGVSAADGIISGVGNAVGNFFGLNNTSGIHGPTETTSSSSS